MTVSLYPKTTVWFRHKVPRGASFKVQWCFLLKICEKYCGFILVYLGFSEFSKPVLLKVGFLFRVVMGKAGVVVASILKKGAYHGAYLSIRGSL